MNIQEAIGTERRRAQAAKNASSHVHPARMQALSAMGIDFVASHSEGYRVWDLDGREFRDMDLRGGVYNLGHRNPQITEVLTDALRRSDMGFGLFPGEQESAFAAKLAKSCDAQYTVFTPSGTEANDMAIRSARRYTGKRRIISYRQGYHGASGLASAAGDPGFAVNFNSDYPNEFVTVPIHDLNGIEQQLGMGDVAAVLLEPACNAAAYPPAPESYWTQIQDLCHAHKAVLIIDEVVTGLGRSGAVWGHQKINVRPDIVVCGKGLSGGIYPMAATILSGALGHWLENDMAGYSGTFAGGELASAVGSAAFDLSTSTATLTRVNETADYFSEGLATIAQKHSIIGRINQFGLLFGIDFHRDGAGLEMTSRLFRNGVLTFPAVHSPNSLNLKLGHLVDRKFCDEVLERVDTAIGAL